MITHDKSSLTVAYVIIFCDKIKTDILKCISAATRNFIIHSDKLLRKKLYRFSIL